MMFLVQLESRKTTIFYRLSIAHGFNRGIGIRKNTIYVPRLNPWPMFEYWNVISNDYIGKISPTVSTVGLEKIFILPNS